MLSTPGRRAALVLGLRPCSAAARFQNLCLVIKNANYEIKRSSRCPKYFIKNEPRMASRETFVLRHSGTLAFGAVVSPSFHAFESDIDVDS